MNKISCDMCIDLMPLVQDGVASEDSRNAVLQHLEECSDCRALYEGEIPTPSNTKQLLSKLTRRAQVFSAMIMMFGIFYGLMLTAGNGIFMNVIIMPIIGGIGYFLFRWKGLYIIPALLFVTHIFTNAMGLGGEVLEPVGLFMWTIIYCCVAMVGFIIAALLHFAFKKEDDSK